MSELKEISKWALIRLAVSAIHRLESDPTCYCDSWGVRCFPCELTDAIKEVTDSGVLLAISPPPLKKLEEQIAEEKP